MESINPPKKEIELVLEWVNHRLKGESEPPWAWFRLMKLREACREELAALNTKYDCSAREYTEEEMNALDKPETPDRHLFVVGQPIEVNLP